MCLHAWCFVWCLNLTLCGLLMFCDFEFGLVDFGFVVMLLLVHTLVTCWICDFFRLFVFVLRFFVCGSSYLVVTLALVCFAICYFDTF